jgi:thiamine pyrophosphokinase
VRVEAQQPAVWQLEPGTGFSLLPLAGAATGVNVEGARYPVQNAVIQTGGPATISNRVSESPLRISLSGGALLVAVERSDRLDLIAIDD